MILAREADRILAIPCMTCLCTTQEATPLVEKNRRRPVTVTVRFSLR